MKNQSWILRRHSRPRQYSTVRGVQSASYYYCNDDHGFLLVKLHDKELLYKDVPLNVWFEFKFANSLQTFYKDQIKYDFIAI